LHGTSSTPEALILDTLVPSVATRQFRDSAAVSFNGGNHWKEIGTWSSAPGLLTGTVGELNDLHIFVGLKNSDDEGTRFGFLAEAYKNGSLLISGQTLCVTGVTRNPDRAKRVIVALGAFPPEIFGPEDVLSVKVSTRIGTAGASAFCGGHRSAAGLRLYFD